MQPLSLDVRHLNGQSHAGAALSSRHQLSSSQGEHRLCALDSHSSTSALQPTECSSQPVFGPPVTQQRRVAAQDTDSRGATLAGQQVFKQPRAYSSGHEDGMISCNDLDDTGTREHGSFTEHGDRFSAHRDVMADMTDTAHTASPPGKIACTKTGTKGLRANLCSGASSLPVTGLTHARGRPPATLPEQSGSAAGLCGVAAQEAWVLQIQKRHAKTAKDALKALGFLDRDCKVPVAQRSDAEVALPLTSSGVAYLSTCQDRVASQLNGPYKTVSASTAMLGCSNGHCGLSQEDPKSGVLPKTKTSETPTQQDSLQVLEHFLAQGLARMQTGQALQRSGRATPADVLLHAVLSALASKGPPGLTCQ